jgi:hypothetical protein
MNDRQKRPPFLPGLMLAEGFYHEEVEPILEASFPDLKYSAALIGGGSEVLGFDTEMSTDHHWGPRVMLFLNSDDYGSKRDTIRTVLSNKLPMVYRGYPTNFSEPDPEDNGTQILRPVASGPVNHRVETFTITGFFTDYMGIDINKELESIDWLTLPQQKLRSVIAGKIFHDGLGLNAIRERFSWYPHDIWLYILASLWARIGQEEHLMGRTGILGDENGSAIIASRIARDIMRLAFLMEKEYPPYAKWLGTAFSGLKSAVKLEPVLTEILHAGSWQKREKYLSAAYEILAGMHNDLGITETLSREVSQFWGRPFKVIRGEKFTAAILKRIKEPQITSLMKRSPIGSVDIFSDNSDMLEDASLRPVLRRFYE